jgi:hypothetical protein
MRLNRRISGNCPGIPGINMKITYTRDEVIEIMKLAVAELIDVDITDIEFSHYGNDFLHIECTKQDKKFKVEPSYQTPL